MQRQITILDRTWTLRADDGDALEDAAQDVDRRMRELRARSPSMDPQTVATLTALNLASELRSVHGRYRARLEAMDRGAAAVEAVLDAAVSGREGA